MKLKDKWLIEEIYDSEECRHKNIRYMGLAGYFTTCNKDNEKCIKETCPIRVK